MYLPLLALLSCVPVEPTPLPPPPLLQSSPLALGHPFQLLLDTGVPHLRVVFLRSDHHPEPGPCPPVLNGACAGLVAPRLIADVRADARGVARATWVLPPSASIGSIRSFQALALLPGGPAFTSTLTGIILDPLVDHDHDGLSTGDEIIHGTDPGRPDTDGGGSMDGQEVSHDHTDPVRPADDVHVEADCLDRVDGDGDGWFDCGDPDCGCGEVCGASGDFDGDGLQGCADPGCVGNAACLEVCSDGRDNDGDGRYDCFDTDCAGSTRCEFNCADRIDDDRDGMIDCADPDCRGTVTCRYFGEACTDGLDNDGDGQVDCADSCGSQQVCHESCNNGVDDDQDGLTDCADSHCWGASSCREDCRDAIDNDRDGYVDCEDPACRNQCEEVCGDGIDNNGDVLADCADPACSSLCFEVCDDGIDSDGDGLVDCDDPSCGPLCRESCADGVDGDGDGDVDCDDPDCWGRCVERCHNGLDDDRDERVDCQDPDCHCAERCSNGRDDDLDGLADCADPECSGLCGEICDNGADDDLDGLVDCEDGGCTDLCVEVCTDGQDNDGDLWTDCQDEECWHDPGCPADESLAWVLNGSLRTTVSLFAMQSWYGYACGINEFETRRGTASNVHGLLRVSRAGREVTCTWAVGRAKMVHTSWTRVFPYLVSVWYSPHVACDREWGEDWQVERSGVWVAPGCGTSGTAFLPSRLDPGLGSVRTELGRAWYAGVVVSSIRPTYSWWGSGLRTSSAVVEPLEPINALGTCAVGRPSLISASGILGGRLGVCGP
jgi:hypothetical protein